MLRETQIEALSGRRAKDHHFYLVTPSGSVSALIESWHLKDPRHVLLNQEDYGQNAAIKMKEGKGGGNPEFKTLSAVSARSENLLVKLKTHENWRETWTQMLALKRPKLWGKLHLDLNFVIGPILYNQRIQWSGGEGTGLQFRRSGRLLPTLPPALGRSWASHLRYSFQKQLNDVRAYGPAWQRYLDVALLSITMPNRLRSVSLIFKSDLGT